MHDYSTQLETFYERKVVVPSVMTKLLRDRRKANRDRLISRLPDHIPGISVDETDFYPQGSVAMGTVIQISFDSEDYDIDDGLVLQLDQLVDKDGDELSAADLRKLLKTALEDARFKKQPELKTNCVRVFYADDGSTRHHVDIPVYRKWSEDEDEVQELASEDGWRESDPTQVNKWFRDIIEERNAETDGQGSQLRKLVRLMKRFCRSREDWLDLLPNGMKLTMLAVECQDTYDVRLDVAFRSLLESMQIRLRKSKVIRNLAHPDQPEITRTENDDNVVSLLEKVDEAVDMLADLDAAGSGLEEARNAWDWIFQTSGFFEKLDAAFRAQPIQDARGAYHRPSVDLPWLEPIPWPQALRNQVKICARHELELNMNSWRIFTSGSPIEKRRRLKFEPQTDARGEFEFYWQVVNTGDEARRARCLRGEILEPNGDKPGVRTEATGYRGRHWVECFVVKDGICIARSGPFFVVVE